MAFIILGSFIKRCFSEHGSPSFLLLGRDSCNIDCYELEQTKAEYAKLTVPHKG